MGQPRSARKAGKCWSPDAQNKIKILSLSKGEDGNWAGTTDVRACPRTHTHILTYDVPDLFS